MRRFIIGMLLVAVVGLGAEKQRAWQTGTVLDTDRSSVYLGTTGRTTTNGTVQASPNGTGGLSGTYSGHSSTSQDARYATREVEVIDGGRYVYVVSRVLRWRWNKPAYLTVNADLSFAVENHTMYLIDEDGREHKTKIIKRILKTEPPALPKP